MKTRFWGIMMTIVVLVSSVCSAIADDVTTEQLTALSMLNHLTVLTQETNDSRNSRLFMEKAYSDLVNNTYPNSIDSRTLGRLTRLLDTMERYRMINVKRERLQFIYEQNQAQAIRSAIPNPLGLLSAVHSLSPARLIASVVYMAVDSVASYQSASAAAELQYLKDSWALNDEEAEELHQSRKDMFSHMINIVNDYKFDGDLALTEEAVQEFSKWKNESNVVAKIQFLESNQNTYKAYGGYWLVLADAYYNNGELSKCLEALNTYESMDARIFRRDFEFAKVLPLGIAAAEETMSVEDYVVYANKQAEAIVTNTRNEDWALRYFAAQTYISLYDKTKDEEYLWKAYNITIDNVNNLLHEQKNLNEIYLAAIKEESTPKDATNDEKEQISKYNTMLKETRKKEIPPISEALRLNCDLLFALAEQINLSDAEKAKVDAILHPNGERLFLVEPVDNKYWFNPNGITATSDINFVFNGTEMVAPVSILTSNTSIEVSVKEKDETEPTLLTDWRLDRVERKTEGDIATFGAIFYSDAGKAHIWGSESEITVKINTDPEHETGEYTFEYTTESVKKEWYDWLKVWEGHKNEWYDYLKVWDDSMSFVRVK